MTRIHTQVSRIPIKNRLHCTSQAQYVPIVPSLTRLKQEVCLNPEFTVNRIVGLCVQTWGLHTQYKKSDQHFQK